MTKKDIEQIKQYKLEIKMLETQIDELRELYASSGSGLGDGMPHARSTTSKTERLAVQVYELSQKLVDLRSSLFILVKKLCIPSFKHIPNWFYAYFLRIFPTTNNSKGIPSS